MTTNSFDKFIQFFTKIDRERLDGLDASYFNGMDENEKQKAYVYLKNALENGSAEAVAGLKALCGKECAPLFEQRIKHLRNSPSLSEQRLSLALYLWEFTKDIQYQKDMIQFLKSEKDLLKQTAIIFLSYTSTTEELIKNLEFVIAEDNDDTVLHVAAKQLLDRYGINAENKKTKNLYKNNIIKFISGDNSIRQAALKWLREYGKNQGVQLY
jgi:hypothetical protein